MDVAPPAPLTGPHMAAVPAGDVEARRAAVAADHAALARHDTARATAEQTLAAAAAAAHAKQALRELDLATGHLLAVARKQVTADERWWRAHAAAVAAGVPPEEIAVHEAYRRRAYPDPS